MWLSSSVIRSSNRSRDTKSFTLAIGRGLLVEARASYSACEVALEDFLDVLPDMQRIEHLQVGKAVEEDDALHELVGVLHLLDQFLAPFLGELVEAPVVEQAVMQPVLVDRGQLVRRPLLR